LQTYTISLPLSLRNPSAKITQVTPKFFSLNFKNLNPGACTQVLHMGDGVWMADLEMLVQQS
jgi:hypothetical protein